MQKQTTPGEGGGHSKTPVSGQQERMKMTDDEPKLTEKELQIARAAYDIGKEEGAAQAPALTPEGTPGNWWDKTAGGNAEANYQAELQTLVNEIQRTDRKLSGTRSTRSSS